MSIPLTHTVVAATPKPWYIITPNNIIHSVGVHTTSNTDHAFLSGLGEHVNV